MAVTIEYGRSGSGKSVSCLDKIKEYVEQGMDKIILMVPEQLSYYAEKRLVDTIGFSCMNIAEVLSFERLAHRFSPASLHNDIDNAGKSMIVSHMLSQMNQKMSYFKQSSRKPGFVCEVLRLLKELKHYNVDVTKLNEIANDDATRAVLKEKITDLNQIYVAYYEKMAGYFDADDSLRKLSAHLNESHDLEGYHIFIDEFSDFLPQYFEVIKNLMVDAEVHFYICADERYPLKFQTGLKAIKAIERYCQDFGITCQKTCQSDVLRYGENAKDLKHLEENYGVYPYTVYGDSSERIRLFCYDNIYGEVEACAQNIWSLCKNENYRFSDIAIVCTDMTAYLPFIRVVFGQYHLSYFADEKAVAAKHPIILVLKCLFDIVNKNFDTTAIITYLKTGFSGLAPEQVFDLENFALANGIRYQKWTRNEWWENRIQTSTDAYPNVRELNEVRIAMLKPFVTFAQTIKAADGDILKYIDGILAFMDDIHLYDKTQEKIAYFRENGDLELVDEYTKIFNIILHVLNQSHTLFCEESMGFSEFSQMITEAFAQYEISTIPQSLDSVEVGDVIRSKVKDKKVLFILGAVNGSLPSGKGVEGILSDLERRYLAQKDIELAKDAMGKSMDEEFLIYKLLAAPTEKLYLSFPLASFDNMAQRPAEVIAKLKGIFPKLALIKNDISFDKIDFNRFICDKPSFLYAVLAAKNRFDDFACDNGYLSLWEYFAKNTPYKVPCERIFEATQYSHMSDPIEKEKLKLLYHENLYTSVHRLEKFQKCPFSYFTEYVLKLRERKVLQATSQDYGTLIHAYVEQFCRIVKEDRGGFSDITLHDCKEIISIIIDKSLLAEENHDRMESGRFLFLVMRLKQVLLYIVWILTLQMNAGSFQIVGEEIKFADGNGDIPALKIPVNDHQNVVVSGYIDRIDETQIDGQSIFRIIDYKSYRKEFDLGHVYAGADMQLMLYLDAFWESTGKVPAGMYYFKVLDNRIYQSGPINKETYLNALSSRYLLDGLTIGDDAVVHAHDENVQGKSSVIGVGYNKDGTLSKSSLLASGEQFTILRAHTRHIVSQIGGEILKGIIAVSPLKQGGKLSCEYCNYSDICGFDSTTCGGQIRMCEEISNQTVLDFLNKNLEESKGE